MTVDDEPEQSEDCGLNRAELASMFGVKSDDPLFLQALTHGSHAHENGETEDCRSLAFVGDEVLKLALTDILYRRRPEEPEAVLHRLRVAVSRTEALAGVARSLGLGAHLRLGRTEQLSNGMNKNAILARTLKALIGVTHQRCGAETVTALVHRLFDELIERSAPLGPMLDCRTALDMLARRKRWGKPQYRVEESRPGDPLHYTAWVLVNHVEFGPGEASKPKEAEKEAAGVAWRQIHGAAARRPAVSRRN